MGKISKLAGASVATRKPAPGPASPETARGPAPELAPEPVKDPWYVASDGGPTT